MDEVKFLDLRAVTALHQDEVEDALLKVARSGWYLMGSENQRFEQAYSEFTGVSHCVGVGNGLDALTLIYRAYIEMGLLSEGDEVIVPANTYIASVLALTENRLKPVLVEPRADTLELDDRLAEQALTDRTRSVLLVHLYGRCAFTESLAHMCREHGLLLVEDNAQAHGCRFDHRMTGSLGHAAGHSFYPGKNMGALGDAGAVTTDDGDLADMVRQIANYGQARKYVFDHCGRNSRLDELQAAVLSVKLRHIESDNRRRQAIAARYYESIDNPAVVMPLRMPDHQNVYHLFPVLCAERDRLQCHLQDQGIGTMIHYPIPPHRQRCYSQWNDLSLPITEHIHRCELSLPISQAMTDADAERVIEAVNSFRP